MSVSILVLMELCIKTIFGGQLDEFFREGFNPCFNGTMYKNTNSNLVDSSLMLVSILVLMELCIKTDYTAIWDDVMNKFQSLF